MATEVGRAVLPGYVFRTLQVVRTRALTPRMRRITLGGPEITGFGTDRSGPNVKIYLPLPGQERPRMPSPDAEGVLRWPADPPVMRTYSVRRFDAAAGELDLDFVLHGDAGPACAWAGRARPGDHLGVTGPGGKTVQPADWYLIAGDESALPAIGAIGERLPADARGRVLVEVADAAERQPLRLPPAMTVTWCERGGAPAGTTTHLPDAVRGDAIPTDRSVFAWVAGESAAVRALRAHLREHPLDRSRTLTIGYWKRGMAETDYHEQYENDREPSTHR